MKRNVRLSVKLTTLGILGAILMATLPLLPVTFAREGRVLQRRVQGWPPLVGSKDLTEPLNLEAEVDAFLQEKMEDLQIPGAVFVWVQDGKVALAKGYGYADLESQRPVLPGETLFAVGSVSKLLTASAAMQLVERGLLDLHNPVNNYLNDVQVGAGCSEPVTMAHLLTHTAGFDERLTGTYVETPATLVPLKEYIASGMPPCVRPVGQEMSYCNHCYGLAGYLVQEISGLPFEQYVEAEILRPLGMDHSSFRQPLPPELTASLAVGYIFTPEIQPAQVPYSPIFPAGSFYASGLDMAQFMIAQLDGARGKDTPILRASTVQEMQKRQFAEHPRLEGWTYGFFEHLENGQRAIEKGGDITGFSSLMFLLPEQQSGFFFAFNATVGASQGFADPRDELVSLVLEHYYPEAAEPVPGTPSNQAHRMVGKYRMNRYAHTTIDKAIAPLSFAQWRVTANQDGSITLAYPSLMGGRTSRWMEVEPLLFRNVAGDGYLSVRTDGNGRITHLLVTVLEEGVLERVPWAETDTVQLALIGFLLLAFLSVLVWPLHAVIRRLHGQKESSSRVSTWSRALAGSLGLLALVFLIGLGIGITQSLKTMAPQIPAFFPVLLIIPLVAGALTVLVLACACLVWRERTWTLPARMHYSLVALAGPLFVWFCSYWNLLGFKF